MDAKDLVELTQVAAQRRFPRPAPDHISLGGGLRVVIFTLVLGAFVGIGSLLFRMDGMVVMGVVGVVVAGWVSRIPRVAAEWERAIVLRLGRFDRAGGPGLVFVFPVLDTVRFVDTRLLTLDIPHQQVITGDNVPVQVDGVIFFRVTDPSRAITTVQDYRFAVAQYAQATLRDVIGSMSLDGLLSERDQIQERIGQLVEAHSKGWGIHVDSIRLLDINMPEDLKRMMSRQASAEREKRATITKAEGDKDAAVNLAAAAHRMAESPGAMQLRTLQTLDGLGASPSNTVVLALPVDVLDALARLGRPIQPAEAASSAKDPKE